MKAFVTGATGFAGQYLARHLLACGDQVFGTHVGPLPANAASLAAINYLPWDITHPAAGKLLDSLQEFQPTVIYHLAALSHPGSCGDDLPTEACQAVNILGTRHVAELAAQLESQPRVVFVSSSKVYGPRSFDQPSARESDPPQPVGGYAHSKWAAENILLNRAVQGLDVVIARAFNHTGPRQAPIYLVPEWCRRLAAGEDPVHVRSLTTSLDLSDVRDVVRIYRLLAENGEAGEVYNVGRGQPVSTGEIWDLLCEFSGHRPQVIAEKPEPTQQPIADTAKLQAAIGPVEYVPLRQTLQETYQAALS